MHTTEVTGYKQVTVREQNICKDYPKSSFFRCILQDTKDNVRYLHKIRQEAAWNFFVSTTLMMSLPQRGIEPQKSIHKCGGYFAKGKPMTNGQHAHLRGCLWMSKPLSRESTV